MGNLLVTVVKEEGKKQVKLAGFVIGASVAQELSKVNKTARQATIQEWATRFMSEEQAKQEYKCLVTEEKNEDEEEPAPVEAQPTVPTAPEEVQNVVE